MPNQGVPATVAVVEDDSHGWDADAALRHAEETRKHREGVVGSFTPRPFRPEVDEEEAGLNYIYCSLFVSLLAV